MADTAEEIRRRLDGGEWLRPGDVSILLGVNRKTVDRMIRAGTIRYRLIPGTGRHRICHPDDVRRELSERDEVRTGSGDRHPSQTVDRTTDVKPPSRRRHFE